MDWEMWARALRFDSVEEFKEWLKIGRPVGVCGDCVRPAFWPNLEQPCKNCGGTIKIYKKETENVCVS